MPRRLSTIVNTIPPSPLPVSTTNKLIGAPCTKCVQHARRMLAFDPARTFVVAMELATHSEAQATADVLRGVVAGSVTSIAAKTDASTCRSLRHENFYLVELVGSKNAAEPARIVARIEARNSCFRPSSQKAEESGAHTDRHILQGNEESH